MNVIETPLEGLKMIEPTVFGDERGWFYESFNQQKFDQAIGKPVVFVQDNQSCSRQGTLRGLHFQRAPHAQGKLVQVLAGEVFDVAVDIRPESDTFGQWHGVRLSAENKRQLWIPVGFAHGFLVLSDSAHFSYKTTDYWYPDCEGAICWNDPDLDIPWPPIRPLLLSAKDQQAMTLAEHRGLRA